MTRNKNFSQGEKSKVGMLFVLYIYYRLKIASADECSHRKGNQGVDDARNDPLLNQGQQKVDPDNHFQGPTQQEPARDVRQYISLTQKHHFSRLLTFFESADFLES